MSRNATIGPVCRLCSFALKSVHGCTLCKPVKEVLIWPAVSDQTEVESASATAQMLVRLLRKRIRQHERAMQSDHEGSDHALTKSLTSLGRTLKEVGTLLKQLEDREEQQYQGLGYEGRIKLFVHSFFAELPADRQVELLTAMKEVWEQQNQSLLPEGGD